MARWLKGFALLLLGVLAGCDQAAVMKKITAPEDEAIAKRYVELLRQNKFDRLEHDFDPGINGPNARATLSTMAAMLPADEPLSIKVVGYGTSFFADSRRTSVTLEYEFPHTWLLATIVTQKKGEAATLAGFHLTPISDSLENINRFTLVGKSASQYTVLLLAITAPLCSLIALIVCIKAKIGRKKWLWLALTLVGVGKLSVDWTSGQVFLTPLAFQLPPGGAAAALYGPWQVYVSLPLGAIIFLIVRKRLVVLSSTPLKSGLQVDDGSSPHPVETGAHH